MIVKLLRNWLIIGFINIIIGFYNALKPRFKNFIISLSSISANEARYAFAGDIE